MTVQTFRSQAQTMHTGRAPFGAFDEIWFEQVFNALDCLHDAVSGPCSAALLPVAPEHMVGWLEEYIYTAQETIRELRTNRPGSDRPDAGKARSAIGAGFRLDEREG